MMVIKLILNASELCIYNFNQTYIDYSKIEYTPMDKEPALSDTQIENQESLDLLDNGFICFEITNLDSNTLKIKQINQFAIDILGIETALMFQSYFCEIAPFCFNTIKQYIDQLVNTKTVVRWEILFEDKDIILASKAILTTSNEIKCIFYDVTQQRKYEKQLKEQNEEIQTQNEDLSIANEELTQSSENLYETNSILIQQEKELIQINGMLHSVINHIPIAVFWKDTNSVYMGCNSVFAKDANVKNLNDVVGKTDYDFFVKDNADRYRSDDLDVMRNNIKKLNFEEPQRKQDGTMGTLRTNKVPLLNHKNEVIGIIGTYEDITGIKDIQKELITAKEKAEESDRLKSAFLANMSHEIRTPMNGIIGFSQMLKEDDIEGSEKNTYIDIINESSNQLLSIVNDIIDISKIEAGLIELHIKQVDLRNVIVSLHSFYSKIAEQNNLKLHLDINIADTYIFHQDETKIQQIISNLVSNAIKFTKEGTITIKSKIQNNLFHLEVIDTGIGISDSYKDLIFKRFRQGTDSPHSKKGTGLGLSICKGYVEKMGGTINFESSIGKGSVFYIDLPSLA